MRQLADLREAVLEAQTALFHLPISLPPRDKDHRCEVLSHCRLWLAGGEVAGQERESPTPLIGFSRCL